MKKTIQKEGKRTINDLGRFEERHKIISFVLILLTTIAIIRILVVFYDPNPIIKGIELHHFHYGLILLIITNLLLLYGRGNFRIHLILSAVSIGLILDELLFISKKAEGYLEYSSTFLPTIILTIILFLIIEFIFYFHKKQKSR